MHFGLVSSAHDVGRDFWLAGRPGLERVEIEIGPGNCGFLRGAAEADPKTLFVGIEILPQALGKARSYRRALPPNLYLFDGDGGWIVRHLLAPASVDAFHVYFPDPWWKKRHQKRRLFQPAFCEALRQVLLPGGPVQVVTDVVPLFEEIRERMVAAGFAEEPWQRRSDGLACSAYEAKYRRQNRQFQAAIFRNG